MNKKHPLYFIVACSVAIIAFISYQSFFGDGNNQAHASFSLEDGGHEYFNYKPALKRKIRSRLREDADYLLDLKGHDVVQVFDSPEIVRRDLPTTVWQYRNTQCVMDIYFMVSEHGDVGGVNVAYYELRARDKRSNDFEARFCVRDLMKRNISTSLLDTKALYKVSAR